MKKSFFGMAAAAVILLGVTACGNKSDNAADTDKTQETAQPQANETETTDVMPVDEATMQVKLDSMAMQEVVPEPATEAAPAPEAAPAKETKQTKGDGYKTTASGLKYKVLRAGKGKSPKATDVVLVNYEGKLTDGTVFDSSYQRGEPISFPLNRVIAGWTEGVQLMQEGAEYEFYIPYQLAYGERGGGPIPPKADLIFRVELIEVQ